MCHCLSTMAPTSTSCSSRVNSTHAFDVRSLSSLGEQAVSFLFPWLICCLNASFLSSSSLRRSSSARRRSSFPSSLFSKNWRMVIKLSLSSGCCLVWPISSPSEFEPDSTAVVALVDDFFGGISIVAINGNIVRGTTTLLSNSQVPTPLPPDVVQRSQTSCTTNAATRVHTMQLPFPPQ